jgi:hypothetical protein
MRATELSVKRTVKERTIRRGGRVMYRLVESTSDFILEKFNRVKSNLGRKSAVSSMRGGQETRRSPRKEENRHGIA